LTFTYDFQHDEDQVFFAYSYPYTYSDLTDEITAMERDVIKGEFISRNILCRTIAGNKCEYLTITAKKHPDLKAERKGIFLSARIHPGESNSSWIMKGIIDFLVSNCPEAIVLREKFVFKIVPMLNPDGVINGNYRCSLSGADLNRRWRAP
jgi:murein tripeptide amidase MpaA